MSPQCHLGTAVNKPLSLSGLACSQSLQNKFIFIVPPGVCGMLKAAGPTNVHLAAQSRATSRWKDKPW